MGLSVNSPGVEKWAELELLHDRMVLRMEEFLLLLLLLFVVRFLEGTKNSKHHHRCVSLCD